MAADLGKKKGAIYRWLNNTFTNFTQGKARGILCRGRRICRCTNPIEPANNTAALTITDGVTVEAGTGIVRIGGHLLPAIYGRPQKPVFITKAGIPQGTRL